MPTLDPGKLDLIAQYLNSFPAPGKGPIGGAQEQAAKDAFQKITGSQLKTDGDLTATGTEKWDAYYNEVLVENGLSQIAHVDAAGLFLINRLVALVGGGILSADEAEAFLNSKYGVAGTDDGYNFAWVPVFGTGFDSPSEVLEQQVSSATDGLTESEEPSLKDVLSEAKANLSPQPAQQTAIAPYIHEPQISEDAEPSEIANELQLTVESLQQALEEIKSGQGNIYPPNSIHGAAIIPGTLAASKLASGALFSNVSQFPQADEAVEIQLSESSTTDRWLTTTVGGVAYNGPGRVQNVIGYQIPKVFRPDKGVVRYRIIAPGVRLTVLSITTDAVASYGGSGLIVPSLTIQYGLVISGIPNFLGPGRRQLLAAPWAGDPPSSLERVQPIGNGGLFEEWANDTFGADVRTLFEEFAPAALAGSSSIYPTKPSWRTSGSLEPFYTRLVEGFTFSLVSGRRQDEAYAELNGRPVPMHGHLGGVPTGPWVSAPPGLRPLAPAPASAAELSASGYSADALFAPSSSSSYATANKGQFATGRAITGSDEVLWGVPFLGEDCHKLRQTDETFSLVVQLWPPKRIPASAGVNGILTAGSEGMRPATWGDVGLEVKPAADREVAVDIVVA